jgi:hypothetical protein
LAHREVAKKSSKVSAGYDVRIERRAPTKQYPFERFFRGFGDVPAVRELFGSRTGQVLRELKVEFFSARFGYMSTSDVDGHLIISSNYLRTGEFRTIYLDIVHELCHVRQFRRKQPLFYPKLSYVDAPSEIEAYAHTVKEGRRIGMTDAELVDYLTIEWIDAADLRRLARRMGVLPGPKGRKGPRA